MNIGQKLKIPTKTDTENTINYIVQSGDTLYGIANKFNITVDELRKINNITTNTLSIGQMLRIPTVNSYTYTVQGGDTLYSIANKFNTTVADLINKNDLTSTLLSVGQILQL